MNANQTQESLVEGVSNATRQSDQIEISSGMPPKKVIPFDVISEETLPRQGDNLRRAQSEYSLGRYDEARQILEKIANYLDSAPFKSTLDSANREQHMRLAASAYTLLGRTYARLRLDDESVRASLRAVKLFDAVKDSDKLSGPEMNDLGIALQLAQDTDKSVEMLLEAAKLGSATAEAYFYLGMHMFRLKDYQKAETYLSKASSLEASDLQVTRLETLIQVLNSQGAEQRDRIVTAYNELSEHFLRLKRPDDALVALDQASKLDPNNADALRKKVFTLIQLERYEEAVAAPDHALKLDPNNVTALGVKGIGLYQLGRYEEAVAAFDRAEASVLDNLPDLSQAALTFKGVALFQLKRYEEAVAALDRALKLNPNNDDALGYKGLALVQLSRYEQAVETLDRAIEIPPQKVWVLTAKGDAQRLLGRKDEALKIYDQALAEQPNDVMALSLKGMTLIELGRVQDAIHVLDDALNVDPKYAIALSGKAWALMRQGDYNGARAIVQRALEVDPGDAWARALYGTLLCDIADYEQAIHELKEAAELDRTMGWAFGNLGEAYARLAQEEQDALKAKDFLQRAVDAYTSAVELDKEDLAFQTWLADAQRSIGGGEKNWDYGIYRRVIEHSKERASLDFYMTEAVGWCYYRLATQGGAEAESMLTESERLLVESLAVRKDKPIGYSVIMTKFRLALVILHSDRYQLALREYKNSCSLLKEKQVVVQRGIFDRARKDLREAMIKNTGMGSVSHAERILKMLQTNDDLILTPPS
ncbi:MAG TPA: tetratricopeptide repeat protein [Blastocatellia bacterium]|nr:tetratricopeptide repeat protein [Blastocatellia bacterium]